MSKKQIQADCKRFAYLYKIDLSGNEKSGIAVMCEGYATAFDTWQEALDVFRTWRDGANFRSACLNPVRLKEL